jgi:hypothetical protein
MHVRTLRDRDVKYTELAYELTYGISEKEKGKKVEWDNKARFTKNDNLKGGMRKLGYANECAVIKRAEYRKPVPG